MHDFAHQKIALLLMAAGESSRLGEPKQLVEISEIDKEPQSLLKRQVTLMSEICLSTSAKAFCVIGCQNDKLINHLSGFSPAQNLTFIDNVSWSQGLSNSIAKGVTSLSLDVSAVLIFLVDQWQLTTEDLLNLINEWRQSPKKIHIASGSNKTSPPVIIPRSYFKELMQLNGDLGARKIIKKNIKQVRLHEMPSAFADLDTPEQLKELIKINRTNKITSE